MINAKTGAIAALAILLSLGAPSFAQDGSSAGGTGGGSTKTGTGDSGSQSGDSSQGTPGSNGGNKVGSSVSNPGDTSADAKTTKPTTTTQCPEGKVTC